MATVTTTAPHETAFGHIVRASQLSLGLAGAGFLFSGVGYVLDASSSSRVVFVLEVVGAVLIALGIVNHIDHLGRQLGHLAVGIGVVGALLWAGAQLPYAIDPGNKGTTDWYRFEFGLKGAGLLLFAVTLFLAVWRKEAQLERGTAPAGSEIHAPFFSLMIGAIGALLLGLAFAMFVQEGRVSRLALILDVLGPLFIATGITAHIDHMTRRIGRLAVVLAIVGLAVWALSAVPFAIDPTRIGNSDWKDGLDVVRGVSFLIGAASLAFVLVHKQSNRPPVPD
jgi:hypothetical protein